MNPTPLPSAEILIWSSILNKVFHECFSNVCLSISRHLQQLFNCSLLYRLSLPDNDLTALPPGIANLTNLRELDVSKNSKQNSQYSFLFFFSFLESSYVIRRPITEAEGILISAVTHWALIHCNSLQAPHFHSNTKFTIKSLHARESQ